MYLMFHAFAIQKDWAKKGDTQQKTFCILHSAKTSSAATMQRMFNQIYISQYSHTQPISAVLWLYTVK
jgi:hypothetical protein